MANDYGTLDMSPAEEKVAVRSFKKVALMLTAGCAALVVGIAASGAVPGFTLETLNAFKLVKADGSTDDMVCAHSSPGFVGRTDYEVGNPDGKRKCCDLCLADDTCNAIVFSPIDNVCNTVTQCTPEWAYSSHGQWQIVNKANFDQNGECGVVPTKAPTFFTTSPTPAPTPTPDVEGNDCEALVTANPSKCLDDNDKTNGAAFMQTNCATTCAGPLACGKFGEEGRCTDSYSTDGPAAYWHTAMDNYCWPTCKEIFKGYACAVRYYEDEAAQIGEDNADVADLAACKALCDGTEGCIVIEYELAKICKLFSSIGTKMKKNPPAQGTVSCKKDGWRNAK
jgi:hypothetical protein